MDENLKFLLIVYGPIVAFVYFLIFADWLGRRHDRKSKTQKPA